MAQPADNIKQTKFVEALSDRYLAYAMSTITSRSLPDLRDGLKPVHRRILYAMQQLRLDPLMAPKKCARIVGDVIGKFHPHGDMSVYDALVRLAQTFAVRYPLVDGRGNFGSIDGDGAAAYRYTESRLTETAILLLEGIKDGACDFRLTYDNENEEPSVLPGLFPNLLANGATGIAVGMATSIPSHNVIEIYKAARLLIATPDASIDDLLDIIPGPDFPTGGDLVEDRHTIKETYITGKGSLRVRACWEVEKLKGGNWIIIITQLPYQVQKSRLIEQIASEMEKKQIPLLADIYDESTQDIRLVLVPKSRTANPVILMETLFRHTALESRISVNMNVLNKDGVPGVLSLKNILLSWLDHIFTVLKRKSIHRLEIVNKRLEILEGVLLVFLNLDEVIRIIRQEDKPKDCLKKTFNLTDIQADYILDIRLRSLRKLEEEVIRKEKTDLDKEKKELTHLLASEKLMWKKISATLLKMENKFSSMPFSERRTHIKQAPEPIDISIAYTVEKEPISVLLSKKGWIRALKGHNIEENSHRFKEGDDGEFTLECQTIDKLCLMGSNGRAYTIKAADLPRGKGFGNPIRTLIDLPPQSKIIEIFLLNEKEEKWVLVSKKGRIMSVLSSTLSAERKTGRQIFNLNDDDSLISCLRAQGDHILSLTTLKRVLIFPMTQVPVMTKGKGVSLQRLSKDAEIKDVRIFNLSEGLKWRHDKNKLYSSEDLSFYIARRGAIGKGAPQWMLRK